MENEEEPILQILERMVAERIADQEARPRKWQDPWYVRMTSCNAISPGFVGRHLGECTRRKNHRGPHKCRGNGMVYTWQPFTDVVDEDE